jgi:hypothetical protein
VPIGTWIARAAVGTAGAIASCCSEEEEEVDAKATVGLIAAAAAAALVAVLLPPTIQGGDSCWSPTIPTDAAVSTVANPELDEVFFRRLQCCETPYLNKKEWQR